MSRLSGVADPGQSRQCTPSCCAVDAGNGRGAVAGGTMTSLAAGPPPQRPFYLLQMPQASLRGEMAWEYARRLVGWLTNTLFQQWPHSVAEEQPYSSDPGTPCSGAGFQRRQSPAARGDGRSQHAVGSAGARGFGGENARQGSWVRALSVCVTLR